MSEPQRTYYINRIDQKISSLVELNQQLAYGRAVHLSPDAQESLRATIALFKMHGEVLNRLLEHLESSISDEKEEE